ncbi:TIR-only protein, partial [Cucurbita argyrosperma subsp. sororia]
MQRSPAAVKATHLCAKIKNRIKTESPDFDVFISHRGIDTRRSVAGILHEHFSGLGLRPFLDVKSMSPGDNLIGKIDSAIRSCRVGVPVFSPRDWSELLTSVSGAVMKLVEEDER